MARTSRYPTTRAVLQDSGVADAARRRLRQSGYPALHEIECQHHEGIVFLRGRVRSYYLKQVAQEAIRCVAGVEQIINDIEVVWRDKE